MTSQMPDRQITAGDFVSMFIKITNEDWTDPGLLIRADVRRKRRLKSGPFGSWVISERTFDGTDTVLKMHLTPTVSRAIGKYGEAHWDLQVDFPGSQPRTICGQKLTVRQDVTE